MKIPYWANYTAIDPDGDVMAFEREPQWSKEDGWMSAFRFEVIDQVEPPEDAKYTKRKIFKLSQFKQISNGTEEQCRGTV